MVIAIHESAKAASGATTVDQSSITKCRLGKQKEASGFQWRDMRGNESLGQKKNSKSTAKRNVPKTHPRQSSKPTSTLNGNFFVDKIVQGPRPSDGKFLVKWLDYKHEANTWEPADNLNKLEIQAFLVRVNYKVGQKVESRWNGEPRYYPGTIEKKVDDDHFQVRYVDDMDGEGAGSTFEKKVHCSLLREVGLSAAEQYQRMQSQMALAEFEEMTKQELQACDGKLTVKEIDSGRTKTRRHPSGGAKTGDRKLQVKDTEPGRTKNRKHPSGGGKTDGPAIGRPGQGNRISVSTTAKKRVKTVPALCSECQKGDNGRHGCKQCEGPAICQHKRQKRECRKSGGLSVSSRGNGKPNHQHATYNAPAMKNSKFPKQKSACKKGRK
jgi:hypothetical protein